MMLFTAACHGCLPSLYITATKAMGGQVINLGPYSGSIHGDGIGGFQVSGPQQYE